MPTVLSGGWAKTCRYLDSSPADRPLGVQLFGSDPETLAEAVRTTDERGADLIDMNMGCPVKKVVKTGSGAALMRDPQRVVAILQAIERRPKFPLPSRSAPDGAIAKSMPLLSVVSLRNVV